MTLFLLLALVALLAIGTPVGMALGLAAIVTSLLFTDVSLAAIAARLLETLQHHGLQAIPFFILAGALLSTGGVARRILGFAVACIGHLRGGPALACVPACMVFAALAGSSPVAVVAIGSIVIAGMVRAGYGAGQAAGVIGAAATMGALIPPAIVLVVYAAVTGSSVDRMFLAGAVPAIAVALMLMTGITLFAWSTGLPRQPRAGLPAIWAAGRGVIWDLLPIAIVMGAVCGGLLSATEAAAVAAAYAFVVAALVDRDLGPLKGRAPFRPGWADRQPGQLRRVARPLVALLNLAYALAALPVAALHRDVRGVLLEAARTTIVLMFIFVNATLFADVLASQDLPTAMARAIAGAEPWVLLATASVLLLLVGQLMEPAAMVMVAAPLFPIALALGVDPIHLGVVMVVNVEIALMMPPAGLGLFMTAGITGVGRLAAIRAALPWLGILLLFLALLIAFPPLATFLPDLVYGPQVH
jgi:C4-dicarboxylate transporter, DctM subunit